MSTLRDISVQFSKALVMAILDMAQQGKDISRFGISPDTLGYLAQLNNAELNSLSNTPFLHIRIDDRVLKLGVQRVLDSRNRENIINHAIRAGASRAIMQRFARMSYSDFKQRREKLGIDISRSRPPQLTEGEYDRLTSLHLQFLKTHSVKYPMDHLRCLTHLSEHSSIEINRIYSYYYTDNSNRIFASVKKGGSHAG